MAEFLIELYVSGHDGDAVARDELRAREAAATLTAEGTRVRFLRSIYVPEERRASSHGPDRSTQYAKPHDVRRSRTSTSPRRQDRRRIHETEVPMNASGN